MNKSLKYNKIKFCLIFCVILGHITRMYTPDSVFLYYKTVKPLEFLTTFFYGFHMPLFFLISGSIFSYCINDMGKYKNKLKFIEDKFFRLIIPYLFIGIIVMPFVLIYTNIIDISYVEYVVKGIIFQMNNRHLWFLSYLFLYFLMLIFFRKRDNGILYILSLIVCLIIAKFNILLISNIFYYFIFFYTGYMVNQYYNYLLFENNFIKMLFIFLGFLLYTFLILIGIPLKVLQIYGCLYFLILGLNLNIIKNISVVNALNKYSMGIYLFHPLIIYLIFYLLKIYNFNPYFMCIFAFLIAFILSLGLSKLFNMLKIDFLLGAKMKQRKYDN